MRPWISSAEPPSAWTDRENEIYGACLRASGAGAREWSLWHHGWAEFLWCALVRRGLDPAIRQRGMVGVAHFYVDLLTGGRAARPSNNGFNENLALFQQGNCGMWIDATVAGRPWRDQPRRRSEVAEQCVRFAWHRNAGSGPNWLLGGGPAGWCLAHFLGCYEGRNGVHRMGHRPRFRSLMLRSLVARASTHGLGKRAAGHAHPLTMNQDYLTGGRPFAQNDLRLDPSPPIRPIPIAVDPVP